jgi:hypothetical protein
MSTNVTHRHLVAGQRLTVTADASSTGSVVLIENGVPTSSPVNVPAGASRYFGPFPAGRDYRIISETGLLTIAMAIPDNPVHRTAGSMSGIAGNLSVIPAGRDLTLEADSQALVFSSLTVNGSLTVDGELRVQAWPT